MALTTSANFNYEPTLEEIIAYVAEKEDKDPTSYPRLVNELEMPDLF